MNEFLWIKFATISGLACALTFAWIPLMPFYVLAILMLLDTITGIIKTKILAGGNAITSYKLMRGIMLKVLYLTLLFSIGIAIKALGLESTIIVATATSILICGEIYSIIQNVYSAQTGKTLSEYSAFVIFLEKLADFFRGHGNNNLK